MFLNGCSARSQGSGNEYQLHAVNYPCEYMHKLSLNTALCAEQQYFCKLTAQAVLNTLIGASLLRKVGIFLETLGFFPHIS